MADNTIDDQSEQINTHQETLRTGVPMWNQDTGVGLVPRVNGGGSTKQSRARVKHSTLHVKPKTIKRYQVAVICRAALEILAMNAMRRTDRAVLMEHKVLDHALTFEKYAEGVNSQNVRAKMPKDLWRKFEEVRRVVVNDIQPLFLEFLKGEQLRSGQGEADICKAELETRKVLFSKAKSLKRQVVLSQNLNMIKENNNDDDTDDTDDFEEFNESWFPTEWIPFVEFGMPAKVRNHSWNENFTLLSSEGPDSSNLEWKDPSAALAKPRCEYSRSEVKRKRRSVSEVDGSASSCYEYGNEDKDLAGLQDGINAAVGDLAKYRKIHQLNLAIGFSTGERKEAYIRRLFELVDADIETDS